MFDTPLGTITIVIVAGILVGCVVVFVANIYDLYNRYGKSEEPQN